MPERDTFSACHPAVNLLFFLLVLAFTMFLLHPACLVISLACAVAYGATLCGRDTLKRGALLVLPMVLLAVGVNVAFNHRGDTVLALLPTGSPVTLESLLYGLAAGGMLAAVVVWFACWSAVMTSDKLLFLFGRVIPALSLVLSMTLRFIPRFKQQLGVVVQAQRCLGRDISKGTLRQRLGTAVTILSILITWSLENAVGTADAMTSRGYGLPGRTTFALYRLDRRDKGALVWLTFCGAVLVAGWLSGGLTFYYYPVLTGAFGPWSILCQGVYLALCLTPLAMGRMEARAWARSQRI